MTEYPTRRDRRLTRFMLWRSGGIQLGVVEARTDSLALLDYAEREGITKPKLHGTNTLLISPTEKVYVTEMRDGTDETQHPTTAGNIQVH